MVKKYIHVLGLSVVMAFTSCSDYLDSERFFQDRITYDKVFEDKDYSEQWLADCYFHMTKFNQEVASKKHVPIMFASDDMFYSDWGSGVGSHYNQLRNGQFQSSSFNEYLVDSWMDSYKGINKCTIFMNHIDQNLEMTAEEILDYKAQARFCRAYLYWTLLRKFGPIPLLGEEDLDQTQSTDALSVPRNTYDECVEYIANEMVLAAKDLPSKRDLRNVMRASRGAALAVRAKLYLYAASPLMNGNNSSYAAKLVNNDGTRLLSETYDEKKWAKAAAAAKDVMDLNEYSLYTTGIRETDGLDYPKTITPYKDGEFSEKNWPDGYADIDPFESYRSVFNGELSAYGNPELIYSRGQNQTDGIVAMVTHQLPISGSGWNCHGTTQKMVDAYYMLDGSDCPGKDKEIGKGDGSERLTGFVTAEDVSAGRYKPLMEGVSLQYANREPRFYASVSYNGALWNFQSATKVASRNQQIWYYRGSQNGRSSGSDTHWLITGYGIKKYVKPSDCLVESGTISDKVPTDIRYADILLAYAEALNELTGSYEIPSWDGSKTHTVSRITTELEKGIHPIRIRAGLPDYPDSAYANADEMRKLIKRERQIEFMCEGGHRYYDLRRWMDAAEEESTILYGCNTIMTKDQADLFHVPVAVTFLPANFTEKTYFWPIPKEELKRNLRLVQNPGWDTYD